MERAGMKMTFTKDNETTSFDFTRNKDVSSYGIHTGTDALTYLYAAIVSGYQVIVEINNPSVWKNTECLEFFEQIGIQKDSINQNTDFIVWGGFEKPVTALDNFHISGSNSDTSLGKLSLFVNDEGIYGVYLNDKECFVSSQEENIDADIRIILVSSDTAEVSDIMTFKEL
ncbi:MAG: hypothetical protein K2K74_18140 [Lachnospiraceae bacterium]|nr:hypothetical protein [Lachnospiraceae bacterium]